MAVSQRNEEGLAQLIDSPWCVALKNKSKLIREGTGLNVGHVTSEIHLSQKFSSEGHPALVIEGLYIIK